MKAGPGGSQQWPDSLKCGDRNAKPRWSIRHLLSADRLQRLSYVNAHELKFRCALLQGHDLLRRSAPEFATPE
jgi:hypothetical protein